MNKYYVMDGNEACATIAYMFSEICGIYPITPASPMAALCDRWSSEGKKNIFGSVVKIVEMQSEAGAAAMVHGSLQAGSLSTTFTASQGLLLMIPSMYKISGEMLPGVIHVAARSISTHALSIFGDHQDVYAVRQTGFAILASSNVQDAHYLALISHLSAIDSSLPFLHFFDGFRTSHELNKIKIIDPNSISKMIDKDKIKEFKKRALNIGNNIVRGTSQTEDVYFQNTEVRNKYYDELPDIVAKNMEELNKIEKTNYKPFNYYGSKTADRIIVAMGSVTDTIKLTVEKLNKNGENVGVIIVHLYRPFSKKYFFNVLPDSVSKIAVLDRTKEPGSIGEPLFLDVTNALKDNKNIKVYGGRFGLSSKNTTPSHIKAVFDNLSKREPKNNFTIGIVDDITNKSLEITNFDIDNKYKEIKVFGFGSDGMVSGAKNIMKVLGKNENKFVQGYFEYDSKKSGGVTIGHLRIHDKPINAPYYPSNLSLIVLTKESYLNIFDVLKGLKENGIFLLTTSLTDEQLNEYLANKVKKYINEKNIKFYVVDTSELNQKYKLNGKINTIVSAIILKMLGSTHEDEIYFKEIISKALKSKGEEVINNNISVIDEVFDYVHEVNKKLLTYTEEKEINECKNVICKMYERCGSDLKVSDFLEHKDGTYPCGTSSCDNKKISDYSPTWIKENCIQCNKCSFICPHSVIRPFSLTEEDLNKYHLKDTDVIKSIGEENKYFYIGVDSNNCTGCGLCINVCPGKMNNKALNMKNEVSDFKYKKLFEEHENKVNWNKFTVKGLGFVKPVFEYPGACAGCGETAYIKVLTNLFGNEIVISNATGCSSIYGASLPSVPYKIPWVNSLFEDNAEFGFGIHMSYKAKRERIKEIMYQSRNDVSSEIKSLFKKWIDNIDDAQITNEVKEKLQGHNLPKGLKELMDYMVARKVWLIGGDGWAYDIGYGGIDHILASGENIKILVLDTEVYSNTGGQKSKSTRASAVAEFANNGKDTSKKDLFKIAMATQGVYVASVSLGANNEQTIKAFKEAEEYNGPALIIAYSPCIEQGIYKGLSNSVEEQKMLVDSGYNILMRYNPQTKILSIDSKEPDFSLFKEVFNKELRYNNLKKLNPNQYKELYEKCLDDAKNRWIYFNNLKNTL
jgi:pyruvate-ferredoxin/flavodoxin oxidoreductase